MTHFDPPGSRPVLLPDGFTLRDASELDVDSVRDVEIDAGERFRSLPGGLAEIADDDPPAADVVVASVANGAAWVVVDPDDHVVGYALASMVDGDAHLDQVSVRTRFGGRGIGTALVEAACDWARRQGFTAITLTTFRDVTFNGPLYRRLGFVEMVPDELGPELRSLRELEQDIGLDVQPRVAMRRWLVVDPV